MNNFDQRLENALTWLDTHAPQITQASQHEIRAARTMSDAALKLTGCYTESNLAALETAMRDFESIVW